MDHILTIGMHLSSLHSDLSHLSVLVGRVCLTVLLLPMVWRATRAGTT